MAADKRPAPERYSDLVEAMAHVIVALNGICDELEDGADGRAAGRAVRTGHNIPGALREALQDARSEIGRDLAWHRPGSWEATHVRALVGDDPYGFPVRYLDEFDRGHGDVG